MLSKLKLAAYVILAIMAVWFGWGFYVNYAAISLSSKDDKTLDNRVAAAVSETNSSGTNDLESANTNVVDAATNTLDSTTNAADTVANNPDDAVTNESESNASVTETNASVTDTNLAAANASTNHAGKASKASAAKKKHSKSAHIAKAHETKRMTTAQTRESMMKNLGVMVLAIIGLGMLLAYDFSHYVANRGVDMLLDDDGSAGKDPEYERAEQVWAEGHPMEAVEMMRNYLKTHPREQFVALRIAEIYEKDFRNYLAAAMEYEEVLKKKLPPENWGWNAIHLCNLYSKLDRQADYDALLHRIVNEYGKTSAAVKARKRLGLPEDGGISVAETPRNESEEIDVPVKSSPPPDEPPSNLPPGFRPK